jgi:hypothetical protein
MKIVISIIFLFTQLTFAQCPDEVTFLERDQKSPCAGFLYSPDADDKANDAFEQAEELKTLNDLLNKKNVVLDNQNQILEKRLNLYIEESQILAERLTKRENRSEWQKVLYFSLGILATGLAVHGAKQF